MTISAELAARHTQSALEDETDRELLRPQRHRTFCEVGGSIQLHDSHWVCVYEMAARRSFDEELNYMNCWI